MELSQSRAEVALAAPREMEDELHRTGRSRPMLLHQEGVAFRV